MCRNMSHYLEMVNEVNIKMSDFGSSSLPYQQAEDLLRHQLSFEKLLGSIFTRFINVDDIRLDDAIQQTLGEVGSFVQADRAYLFLFSNFKQVMSNTHEWCAEGITPQISTLQNLPFEEYSWFLSELAKSDHLYIPCVEEMPAAAQTVKETLTRQDIRSVLHVPLEINKKIAGFLGFDAVKNTCQWSEEVINLLAIVAKIIGYTKEHRKARDTVQVAEHLLDNIGEGIFIIKNPEIVIWANQAFAHITGYGPDEVIGQKHQLLNLVELEPEVFKEMHGSLRELGFWHGVVQGKHKDGHTYPARMNISSTWDGKAKITRHLVILQDLTEHHNLLKEREKLQIQTLTAQKLNSLSTMSAGVVHEIAQPLNSIRVLVDGMLYCHQNNYYLPESEIFEKLGEMSTEIKRIDEIIQHIRTFASLNQSTEMRSCTWNLAVERALSLLGRQLAAHQILVTRHLQEDLPPIYANPNRLDELLLNLLVNAMQALDSSQSHNKEIICRTFSDKNYSILEVADNGTGIDENLHRTIFDPFFTTKKAGEGMGLGLSIVESIMNNLNGQIKVYNNEKGGATFRLELPIYQDSLG